METWWPKNLDEALGKGWEKRIPKIPPGADCPNLLNVPIPPCPPPAVPEGGLVVDERLAAALSAGDSEMVIH